MGITHPVCGRLWPAELYEDGVELRKADFVNIAIEAEFDITLICAIEWNNASAEAIADAVESIFPVLELHNFVLRSNPPHGHKLIANNAIHAGVVRGKGVTGPVALLETDLALSYDEETVDSWTDVRWPHDILSAIEWLAQTLEGDDNRLEKADTIRTSALGPSIPVGDARRVDVTSSAFGNLSTTFA